MIIAILGVLGLCFGSFVNALTWRLHEQAAESAKKKPNKNYLSRLSIIKGHSLCPKCQHNLAVKDLVPILSWLSLKGKCRYCHQSISFQYPLVEAALAALFIVSYIWWPVSFSHAQTAIFVLWLVLLVGLLALLVYDLRWKLLPNVLIYPLAAIALVQAIIVVASASRPLISLGNVALGVLVGGTIFYALYEISGGKWIGGGDVRLGWLLGLIAATPGRALLLIFLAALLGSGVSIPLLTSHRLKRTSTIPFGPFLIIAMIIVQLFGHGILLWYQRTFLPYTV